MAKSYAPVILLPDGAVSDDSGVIRPIVRVPILMTGLKLEPIEWQQLTPEEATDLAIDLLRAAASSRRLAVRTVTNRG